MNELTPSGPCARLRDEIPAYLYCELEAEARAELEQHLASCADCRDVLAGAREARTALDRWRLASAGDDPRALAREIRRQAQAMAPQAQPIDAVLVPAAPRRSARPRLVRWAALVTGSAAALFLALCALSAEVQVGDGSLRLGFSLPGRHRTPSVAIAPDWEQRVRSIAAQEVSTREAGLRQSQEELAQHYSLMTKEELLQEILRLSQAVDVALAENQRTWDVRLTSLRDDAAQNDIAQRRAISDIYSQIRPASTHR